MNKEQKSQSISLLKDNLASHAFVAIAHYRGMTDKQLYDMRTELKAKGCNLKVAKNTLIRIAVKGTELELLTPHLKGPTAIFFSQDPVALSKSLADTAKKVESFKVQIGYMDKALVSASVINELAKLGSLDEVRAKFIGTLKAAQSNFVRIVNAPSEGLASSFPANS